MAVWLQHSRRRLWSGWMSLQVEYQGHYSVDRLKGLDGYIGGLGNARLLLICLLTPLPCLTLGLLNELPPLAPPEAGVSSSKRGRVMLRQLTVARPTHKKIR
ncbi:hypothetical protein L917_21553 [Phytophthora nicotianae]|uniref:Uncharacterized protein n=1 Tax=Phytophthora nicotianae TaxID=4792 RepID=W2JX52_PHYNI|nr:hypothetical protein L917_21553 [Phytophthora nicotianae]